MGYKIELDAVVVSIWTNDFFKNKTIRETAKWTKPIPNKAQNEDFLYSKHPCRNCRAGMFFIYADNL